MKVALFGTCSDDTMFPESAKATVELLERLGVHGPRTLHVIVVVGDGS